MLKLNGINNHYCGHKIRAQTGRWISRRDSYINYPRVEADKIQSPIVIHRYGHNVFIVTIDAVYQPCAMYKHRHIYY